MKTKSKVILDEWFGRLAVNILNIFARILGKILGINHSFNKIPERIVVCKFLGMGSIIQSTPLLQTLRKSFPRAQIYFVTAKANEALLNKTHSINEVWCIDDKNISTILSSSWKLLRKLWKKKADLYIDLETYSYYSTAIATLSLSRNRLGFYRAERNIRLGVYTHMMFFNPRAPIAESYLQMGRLVGCREIETGLFPYSVSEQERDNCIKILAQINPESTSRYIVINPNASDLRIERRWPLENFAALISRLSLEFPKLNFYLIGTKSEYAWVEQLNQMISESVRRIASTP